MTMRALPAKLKFAAWSYAALSVWLVWLVMSASDVALIAPFLMVLAAAPIIGWGLHGVRRWAYMAMVVHAPTVAAIGGITLVYVALEIVALQVPLSIAIVQALALWVFYLRADVRSPY